MRTISRLVLSCFYLTSILFSASSQVNYLSNKIVSALNSEDKKEIMNAEKIKAYGDELMKEAGLIEDEIGLRMVKKEDYLSEKIRQMDNKKLDIFRRAVRKKIRASKHYGNANLITAYVYTKNLKELLLQSSASDNKKIETLIEESSSLMQKSRIIRGKVLQINNEFLVYPHLIDANEIEFKALSKLKVAYSLIYKNAIIDNKLDLRDKDNLSEIKNVKSSKNIYFKIQVAASKESLSNENLKRIYNTDENLSSEYDNGWYKYSVRKKFKTYDEAFNYKKAMNTKNAFILAFVQERKVSVSEAVKLQNSKISTRTGNDKDKIVYRLQIGISTLPASGEKMQKMKGGGKPVVMVDHGGWYTYTIGDFKSRQEADNFKKRKGLTNASVVMFKNDKLLEDD
ncbi:MAG: SPOR domain-containing protein [Bacteroidota bacterium]